MKLIQEYFDAFASKDIEKMEALFHPDATLQAPGDGLCKGRAAVLENLQGIFDNFEISFTLDRWFTRDAGLAVEFHLELTDSGGAVIKLSGIDLFEVSDNQIMSLRAYLDTTVGENEG